MTKPLRKADREAALLARRVKDLHAVGLPAEVAVLATGQDVEVVRAGESRDDKKVHHDVARRKDVFLCIELAQASYEAARRLERDMLTQRGEDDKGAYTVLVDGSEGRCRLDRQVSAGRRVAEVFGRVGRFDALLLSELIYPSLAGEPWRLTVLRVRDEINPVAQSTVIRSACANLALGYAAIDQSNR